MGVRKMNLRAIDEKLVSVTITELYDRTTTSYEDNVEPYTLELMLKADYVTVRGKTIKKKTTRVADDGKVYFYGDIIEEEFIY